jgi:nucleoside-diphosphate-sugar epimerase
VIAVVGAEGTVGGTLAAALGATRVVYREPRAGEVALYAADSVLRDASVVVNAGGFRVRPGLGDADYRRSHGEEVARLVPRLSRGALFLQISSASVLGKDPSRPLGGNGAEGRPETFGCPAYARSKRDAEDVARREAVPRGVKVTVLRPAVLYGPVPDGMIGTLLALAGKGLLLRLVPGRHRHHLCSFPLLVEVVSRLVRKEEGRNAPLVVADPFVLTSEEITEAIRAVRRPRISVPFPAGAAGAALRLLPRARASRLDLRTWGEILGILALDTVYDPSGTFRDLSIDPSVFSRERTWDLLVRGLEAAT